MCTHVLRPGVVSLLAVTLALLECAAASAADIGWVARINGAPTVKRGKQSAALHQGDAVALGDVIETDAASKIKILFADDTILDIGPRSHVALDEFQLAPQSRLVRLHALGGRFKIAISKFFGGSTEYEVRTPTAVAGVRGTILWGDTDLDAICALDGTIQVRSLKGAEAAKLAAGECVHEMGDGKTTPLKPSAADLAAYLKEVTLE